MTSRTEIKRTLWERVLFLPDGRPIKLLRRALFHKNGKPRGIFRDTILEKDGSARPAFIAWMSSAAYLSLPNAAQQKPVAPDQHQAASKTAGLVDYFRLLTPRAAGINAEQRTPLETSFFLYRDGE